MPSSEPDHSQILSSSTSDNSSFLQLLCEGFSALREHQYGPSDALIHLESITPSFLQHAIVNVIDPTASSGSLAFQKPSSPTAASSAPLELYEKLTTILRSEYNSTLKKVPYTSLRSGAHGVIGSMSLQTYMTGSQGGLISISEDSDVPWAKTGSVTGLGSDASEWHMGPYCHVYLAACENLEHYRTKVKPSIQAFLSQIDAIAKYNVSSKDGMETSGSQYVIVFVPSGDSKSSEEGPKGPGGKLGIWASARQRMVAREAAAAGAKDEKEGSTGTTLTSSESIDAEDVAPSGQQPLIRYLSRTDREIMRRLSTDFSAGIVCQLSSLVDNADEIDVELKRLEWKAFLKGLGTAIVNGFRERCRKYDEVLRKLEQSRTLTQQDSAAGAAERFDYSKYFLVKESLAFTYQQLNIPSEASLQYDELLAILPEMKGNVKPKAGGALFAFSATGDPTAQMNYGSISGDPVGFRRRLRSVKDLQPLAHIIRQYLLARQTELTFKMNRPVEVMERCLAFVETMYKFRCTVGEDAANNDGQAEAEAWAFNFCWDVKKASEKFFSDGTESISIIESEVPKTTGSTDKAFARCLCDLLNFARSRYLMLGDIKLSISADSRQVYALSEEFPDLSTPWTPRSSESAVDDDDKSELGAADTFVPEVASTSGNLIELSLASQESFLQGYLDLLKMIEATNRLAERYRSSARTAIEMAGIHVHQKDFFKAIMALKAASTIYLRDQWEMTSFRVLVLLASFQRKISTPDEYVETLVQCFSPAMKRTAPPQALDALQQDLEAVLKSSLLSRQIFGHVPMFDPILGVDGIMAKKKNSTSRDIIKKVYTVGDAALINVSLYSALLNEVEVEEISVEVVPFRTYVALMEDSRSEECAVDCEEDQLQIISVSGPLKMKPGNNAYSLDWFPKSKGQFVLSSATIKWHGTSFSYMAKELKRPSIRIDILPALPTHSVAISPEYLLPGHEQMVTVTLNSEQDCITESSGKISCTEGLVVRHPGNDCVDDDAWRNNCEFNLGSCQPGKSIQSTFIIKSFFSGSNETGQALQSLNVTVSTRYRAPLPHNSQMLDIPDRAQASLESHEMSIQVNALSNRALTVKQKGAIYTSNALATLHITLQNNAPAPLTIKDWALTLPNYLELMNNGDLNKLLVNSRVHPTETICLVFNCSVKENAEAECETALTIHIEDLQERSYSENFGWKMSRPPSLKLPSRYVQAIPIQVSPSIATGGIMLPISVAYCVDLSSFAGGKEIIVYQLATDSDSWVVCGKNSGVVKRRDETRFTLNIVAMPRRPGPSQAYPELKLFCCANDGEELLPLQTECTLTTAKFRSVLPERHTTVAVPIVKK